MDELNAYLERLRAERSRQRRPDASGTRRDEGARRREQQRELMRRLLLAESSDDKAADHGEVIPDPSIEPIVQLVPAPAEEAEVDLRSAVVAVLADLDAPLLVEDLVEWLAESGVAADAPQVSESLALLGERVERLDDGRWHLTPTRLDLGQQAVAFAPIEARMLVVAPPGAGKTEVACARVAHAVNSGVNARSIVLISFTRAATAEIGQRVADMVQGGQRAMRGVEIRTLDSLAWMLQRHLTDEDLLTGSFADNIERCIDLLEAPPDELQEYFESLKLLVIDEAQDLVGPRSELALRLIRAVGLQAGVTVFADPAQAIYGDWALDEGRRHVEALPLHERLDSDEAGLFSLHELTGLHRTDDPALLSIAKDLRNFALVRDMTAEDAHAGIREKLIERVGIGEKKHESLLPLVDHEGAGQLFLFRTHGEVVQLSSYMSGAGISHRLRFPGLPSPVYPWIGRLLGEWEARRLTAADFGALWRSRVEGTRFDTGDPDAAWSTLSEVAGDDRDRVDVLHLREILSRRNPPDGVLRPTLGESGPILGTIHGAKGREADDVVLGLTEASEEGDHGEEARVLYVGATRAKERLRIAEVKSRHYYLSTRRVWRYMNGYGRKNCMQLEFGLRDDVNLVSPVDRTMVTDEEARALQDKFAGTSSGSVQRAYWRTDPASDFRRPLRDEEDDRYIGLVGDGLVNDMWQLARKGGGGLKPGDYQQHLYVVDYTTVARDNDSADLNQLTDTFAASGFWVAPLIKGWGGVCLRYGGRKS